MDISKIDWKEVLKWFIGIGGFGGLLSFVGLSLKDIISYFSKPNLKITSFDKKIWLLVDDQSQKIETLSVNAKGRWSIGECTQPREVITGAVKNFGKGKARGCFIICRILEPNLARVPYEKEVYLHWGDIPYSHKTTEAEPITLLKDEWRRFDIAFRLVFFGYDNAYLSGIGLSSGSSLFPQDSNYCGYETSDNSSQVPGCKLAVPLALLYPNKGGQFNLPPGKYKIEIEVTCENGNGDKKILEISSPNLGEPLEYKEL